MIMRNKIPEGVENYLNGSELEFLHDIINNKNKQLLMRESREMSAEDFAKFIKKIIEMKGLKEK